MTRTRQKERAQTANKSTSEVSKVAVTAMSITAGIIGIWAIACMISGISNSGGPVSLLLNLVNAISG